MPLVDPFGREITNLRISVTDRCNLRCVYCMPAEPVWMPQPEILTFEEIERLVRIAVSLGIRDFRLTGGEPTARKELPQLVRSLAAVPGVRDLAMTTNGILLKKLAGPLRDAGLHRLNISLDTLRGEKFVHLARRDGFRQTWEGIEAADRAGFRPLKINMVVLRGVNDDEVVDFAAMSRTRPWQIRFIEFMPLDGDNRWSRDQVVPAKEILGRIHERWPLDLTGDGRLSDPARVYRFKDGQGDIGVIASVTEPFCGACDRVRVTPDGKLRTCLFSTWETDLKLPMRAGASDDEVAALFRLAVSKKEAGHGINDAHFVKPARAMYAIGG
ncbi:MAG TPA: GTP 3',8-cyclase MoaA [Planctomycetota bacterium]|nr:GTP 3',8-cyclase MoaA [Planctomycetota bacterium]